MPDQDYIYPTFCCLPSDGTCACALSSTGCPYFIMTAPTHKPPLPPYGQTLSHSAYDMAMGGQPMCASLSQRSDEEPIWSLFASSPIPPDSMSTANNLTYEREPVNAVSGLGIPWLDYSRAFPNEAGLAFSPCSSYQSTDKASPAASHFAHMHGGQMLLPSPLIKVEPQQDSTDSLVRSQLAPLRIKSDSEMSYSHRSMPVRSTSSPGNPRGSSRAMRSKARSPIQKWCEAPMSMDAKLQEPPVQKKRQRTAEANAKFTCDHPPCTNEFFQRPWNYTKHMETVHGNRPRPWKCHLGDCDRSFSRWTDLDRHKNTAVSLPLS